MGQLFSFTTSLCLCLLLSTLHNSSLVVSQRGKVQIHPEFIPENPSQIPQAKPPVGNGAPDVYGTTPGGKAQPFLKNEQDAYDVATLRPLLTSLATVISEVQHGVSQKSSSVDLATVTVPPSAAQLGCSIYSAYQSYCQVASTFTASTYCIVGDICAVTSASDLFASCACYSSTYWVPDLYDNAVWACNQISAGNTGFTASVTTIGGEPQGFCAENNPRLAVFNYGLSATTTAATTLSATPTPAGTPHPAPTPTNPTHSGSASAVMMTGWALGGVIAVVVGLIQV